MTFYDFGETIDNDTRFVIFGIPWDYLTSLKAANSAIAPQKIREITSNLALTTEMGVEIPKLKVVDIGNVSIEPTNVNKSLEEIKKFISLIFRQKKDVVPIMIGGDHFCTFPVVKALADSFENKNEFGVLIFDAHLDLYKEWDKRLYSHATISHRLYELTFINKYNMLIVGTRDIDIPELDFAKKEDIVHFNAYLLHDFGIDKFTDNIIDFFENSHIKQIYISIDIDVLDPSIAPGTGYAIPGGFTYRELWKILRKLAKNFNVIAFDLVEVCPNLDLLNNVTSNLAAKLIIELISFIYNKHKIDDYAK